MEGVGIKGGRCAAIHAAHCGALRRHPRCSLLRNSRGASPLGGGAFFTEIIYDDNKTINNYPIYNSDTPRPGAKPPANCEAMSRVVGGATPMHKYTQTSTPSTNPYDSN